MIDPQEIYEALEATATGRKQGRMYDARANASKTDVLNRRDSIMRFLEEVDGELSVAELRDALEQY
ncbi:hypothetical protein [Rhizobium tumorigenes]|uniref:hypothetical protein n=1 Tax=Rhizobium tumorigenes TaxID=2041385 RepID=UPI00241C41AE|nr:hypothetical protein [Rhizobium tumorigenes]WFS01618.1 hypothetical protein PR016_02990 [Rhizobium tumorigenes]